MMINPTSRRSTVACVALLAFLGACRSKEQAPGQTGTQQATPTPLPVTTLPPTTTVPSPPPIWRAAAWGMTKDAVLAAFPGEAQRLPTPADFGPGQASTDLAIPGYEMDGVKYRVLFGFESDALNRIQLSAVKADAETCPALEKALTEKYSAPAQRERTGTSMKGEQITWQRPDQTIILACAGVQSLGYVSATLDYKAPSTEVRKE